MKKNSIFVKHHYINFIVTSDSFIIFILHILGPSHSIPTHPHNEERNKKKKRKTNSILILSNTTILILQSPSDPQTHSLFLYSSFLDLLIPFSHTLIMKKKKISFLSLLSLYLSLLTSPILFYFYAVICHVHYNFLWLKLSVV